MKKMTADAPAIAAHPDDDVVEVYCLGGMKGKRLAGFEEHLIICPSCRKRVASSRRFIKAMRLAATELASFPLNFTHQTGDGPVHVFVRPADGGGWIATVERLAPFDSVEEANRYLLRTFSLAYPGHRCTDCGMGRPRPLKD